MEFNCGSPHIWMLLVLVTILHRFPETASAPSPVKASQCFFPSEKLNEAAKPACAETDKSGISVLCKSTQSIIKKICLDENQEIMSSKEFKVPNGEASVDLEEFCNSVKVQDFDQSEDDKEFSQFFQNFKSKENKLSCFNLCKSPDDENKLNPLCKLFDASSKLLQIIVKSIAVPSEKNSAMVPPIDKPAQSADKPEPEKNELSQAEEQRIKIEARKRISPKPDQQGADGEMQKQETKPKSDVKKQNKLSDAELNKEIKVEDEQANNSAAEEPGVEKAGDSNVQEKKNEKRNDEKIPKPSGGISSSSSKPISKGREGVTNTNSPNQQESVQKPDGETKLKPIQDSDKPENIQPEDLETKNGEEVQDSPAEDPSKQVLPKPDSSQNRKTISNLANKKDDTLSPIKTSEPSKPSETENQPDDEIKPELKNAEKEEPERKTAEEDKQPTEDKKESAVVSKSSPAPKPDIPVAKAPPTSKPKDTEQQESQNEPPVQDPAQSQENNIQKAGEDYEEPQPMDNNDIPIRGPSRNSQLGSLEDSNKVTFQDLDPELENSGYSFNYFVVFLGVIGVGFLLFLNKKRVIALLIEGRKPRGGRTRTRSVSRNGNGGGSSTSYRKLENNFE